ncbi:MULTISPECIES: hypothetical protein [Bacteroides]|uniref:hypothetical protein n=1 Tax=Bacteroides TaxID=816 RepID=UPI0008D974CE|nr:MULTISPECIES: hypothetical protein [Bacteroides]
MDGINSRRFAEMEALASSYFRCYLVPVMNETQAYLNRKQVEEMKEYSTSVSGILGMMATAGQPLGDPYQTLKLTGEWNSKTTEEYIGMCKERILASDDIQRDLACMAGRWRETVVAEIGRKRYDALSEKLGCDLAYAYLDYRMDQLMVDKLVNDRIPKSSAEYIIRKAGQSSLLGLAQTLGRSPLAEEIESRSEAAYHPSTLEKGAGNVLGASADAIMLGGAGSWASLARFVGMDVALTAAADSLMPDTPREKSVEECISKGVFGKENNVFDIFRKEATMIPAKENTLIAQVNGQLRNKIPVINFGFMDWSKKENEKPVWMKNYSMPGKERKDQYKDVPLVVAPGYEDAYLKEQEMLKEKAEAEREQTKNNTETQTDGYTGQNAEDVETAIETREKTESQAEQTNINGWDGLLRSFGLDGMGKVAGNLGYIIAMLPDMLLGLFTGKTKSLGLKDNLLPIASIVAGLFVRNPLLKILLMGLGGANLLNKASKEALSNQQNEDNGYSRKESGNLQYKRYADEPLNPRIANPVLQGCTLIATIDRVPCTIQISPTVADAYRSGAVPLNTLANAILAQSDRLRQMAAENYDSSQQESAARSRGIQ